MSTFATCRTCGRIFKTVPSALRRCPTPTCSHDCRKGSQYRRKDFALRFWNYVNIVNDTDSCWDWTGATAHGGYGTFQGVTSKQTNASRVAWELTYEPIGNPKIFVCHHCDRPICCRPSHLFLGTQAVNLADASNKKRLVGNRGKFKGEKNVNAKLTGKDIPIIRARIAVGDSNAVIAKDYQVSDTAIWLIRKGRAWRHVV